MANYQANLDALKPHLDQGEEVHISCYGAYDTKSLGGKTVKNGILAVTSKRIIQFGKRFSGYNLETFPLDKITAIEISKGLMGKMIAIKMSGNESEMKWINQGDPDGLVFLVHEKIGAITSSSQSSSKQLIQNESSEIPEQIKKLSELKDSGILTEAEFAAKKQELLSRM
jgi:hypothetical protein